MTRLRLWWQRRRARALLADLEYLGGLAWEQRDWPAFEEYRRAIQDMEQQWRREDAG